MNKYFTGINSVSFDRGYDSATGVFDKSKVPEMDEPGTIYFVKNPISIGYDGSSLVLKRKVAARLAKGLAEEHGGVPLVLQCNPNPEELKIYHPGRRDYHVQDSPKTGVERIFLVRSSCSLWGRELFYHLKEISVDKYLEKHFRKKIPAAGFEPAISPDPLVVFHS